MSAIKLKLTARFERQRALDQKKYAADVEKVKAEVASAGMEPAMPLICCTLQQVV